MDQGCPYVLKITRSQHCKPYYKRHFRMGYVPLLNKYEKLTHPICFQFAGLEKMFVFWEVSHISAIFYVFMRKKLTFPPIAKFMAWSFLHS